MANNINTTTYRKLFEYHRKRFPKVKVNRNFKEFKDTTVICLCEILNVNEEDVLENKTFWKEINNFVNHVPYYYEKKKNVTKRMFGAHLEYFDREFDIQESTPPPPTQNIQDLDLPPQPASPAESQSQSNDFELGKPIQNYIHTYL